MTRLKELRQQKKVNQSEIAEVLHVKQNTISNWENGKTEISNGDAITLAEYFGVSVDYLLGREEKTPSGGNLSEGEKMLLDLFNRVPEEKQELLLQLIRTALEMQ
jgi:transcriptional regulator with XRE-family HTH domain